MDCDEAAELRQQLQAALHRAEQAEIKGSSLEDVVRQTTQDMEQQRAVHRLQLLEAKEDVRARMESLIDEAMRQRDLTKQQSEAQIARLQAQLAEKST